MEIVHDESQLQRYINEAVVVSGESPVLIDTYLQKAIEVDVDAVADQSDVYIAGIMEHIEEAGIHSGDSACSIPPYTLSNDITQELEDQTKVLAKALGVVGLMNVQYAVQGSDIFVLEVNPRASRTVPFVAKTIGHPVAKIAARVMVGEPLSNFSLEPANHDYVAVKEAVFPFARFSGVDTVLGPEMRSTGEVMGLDRSFDKAFAKSQVAGGTKVPTTGKVFISVRDKDKPLILPAAERLVDIGFEILATDGTAKLLNAQGIQAKQINKVLEGRPHIVDAMKNGEVQLVFNTTAGIQSLSDSFTLRRSALMLNIPYYTTISGAQAAVSAIEISISGTLEVAPLQTYS
jgi:carbamoyl-phosphate synthase large subunit